MKIAGGPHPHPNPPLEEEGGWMLTFSLKGREAVSNEFNELMWYFQVKRKVINQKYGLLIEAMYPPE
jgi:hypothetical protein